MDEIDHKRVEWDMVCVCVLGMLESLWKKIENKGSRVSRLFRTKVDGLVCIWEKKNGGIFRAHMIVKTFFLF